MKETTLVHIIKDGCVLMLHRISKKHDINHGKWIGVGGKFEWGETPEECMRREVREETGLRIDKYRYCGIVTFASDDDEMEYMHLFTVTGFHDRNGTRVADGVSLPGAVPIELPECNEGTLEWLPKEELTHIPHWPGDRIFLSLILDREIPFFSMKLIYRKGELVQAALNEHNCMVTDRLILRPWLVEDASALYKWAKNPNVGPRAGWLPHMDISVSRDTIRGILTRPEMYAIVRRDTSEPIGSVGLQNFRLVDEEGKLLTYFDERQSVNPLFCTRPESWEEEKQERITQESSVRSGERKPEANLGQITKESSSRSEQGELREERQKQESGIGDGLWVEAELGYWLAEPFWHQGLMTEAAQCVLAHAYRDLGIRRIWADYYEGNEASKRVMQRLGFHFHHVEEGRYVAPLGEKRTAIVHVKTCNDY